MITVERLQQALSKLPKDSKLVAYEGEGIGLQVISADGLRHGFIDTGSSDDVDESGYDLDEFIAE